MKIGFIGLGKLGQDAASVLAEKHEVTGYDINTKLLNDLSTHILFENKSVEQIDLSRSFDVVISNIQSDVLCTNASTLINCMSEKGHLILSGILNTEKNEVSSVFEKEANRVGFRFSTTYTSLSEWTTIKISKQP